METSAPVFMDCSFQSGSQKASGSDFSVPLEALYGSQLGRKFQAWSGRSGRRYVCSVFSAVDPDAMEAVRSYDSAVILAVRCDASGVKTLAGMEEIGYFPDLFWYGSAMTALTAQGVNEFHVHLMAETPAARHAVLQDLLDHSQH